MQITMRSRLTRAVTVAILALLAGKVSGQVAAPASQPAPALHDGKGAFAAGKYCNLFAEIGHTPRDIKAKVEKAYNQLFHGDPQTQALYMPAGKNANGPLAYIPDVQHTDVRSEGMSYGMMITVQLDKKREFDALPAFAGAGRHDRLGITVRHRQGTRQEVCRGVVEAKCAFKQRLPVLRRAAVYDVRAARVGGIQGNHAEALIR